MTLRFLQVNHSQKQFRLPYNQYTGEGTGFSFTNFNAHELKEVMFVAVNTYNNDKAAWDKLVTQAMEKDYSWSSSARKYLELYKKIV